MTVWIGPVEVEVYDPTFAWKAVPAADGSRAAAIDGRLVWSAAQQLAELVANPHRRITVGSAMGVLEYVWASDDMRRPFRGWYLLTGCELEGAHGDSLEGVTGIVPFQLSAVLLGDQRQVVVSRSARTRTNDFDLDGQALAVNPFWGEDPAGEPFVVAPGGTFVAREYDPTSPHDGARLTATDGGRSLGLYVGTPDDLATIVLPDLEGATDYDGQSVPRWITDRGGDCRAYDRREEREVFGPSHPLVASTDLAITNGLVRAWVGARGLVPYLTVQALADDDWHDVGTVIFGEDDELLSARLTRVTPDAVTVALAVQSRGNVFVTLKRGERMLRCQLPSPYLAPTWSGLPPATRAVSAQNGTGKFGNGLDGGGDTEDGSWAAPFPSWAGTTSFHWDGSPYQPDLRLAWPPSVATTQGFARVLWYRPARAVADLGTAGLLTLYDADGVAIVELYLDEADARFKVRVDDTVVLQSAVQTFTAGQDLALGLRFSPEEGLALSVRNGAGTVAHVSAPSVDDLGATRLHDSAYWINFARWGEGDWGDDVWGGTTHFPGGVIDNDMTFDGWLTDAEFVTLVAATERLDGLPTPEARLVWYAPFDAQPLPAMSAEAAGLSTDPLTDDAGFTKGVAFLDGAFVDQLTTGVFLARTGTHETAAAHQDQLAAECQQQVLVRSPR